MTGLALEAVSLSVGGRPLFQPLSLTVAPGMVTTVMGPSGCGKSSLLAFLCGTLDPAFHAAGRVRVDGEEMTTRPPEERRLGILFQDDLLFPHLSVGGNLAFALPVGMKRADRRAEIGAALDEAGLSGMGDRDPATLSGGQRTRAALMRTLLSRPRALLLDEPFARLDAELKGRMRAFVFDHAGRRGLPILLVTHDREDAEAADGPVVALSQPFGQST
ncbi:ATP-binding cassette domain-containing protein [Inquilinus sp. CAU 1745]|uniref:ATP-binding cassette domain-containing protein n=1 Tax=Inquilinus sp. CAU 1745 TaxID=3140369 RepID=UPI00325AB1AF